MIPFAVIGTGWIVDSFVECAHASQRWKLVAVYSRSEETARRFGAKHGCHNTHTSLEALAQDTEAKAVYIASPNSLHYKQAEAMIGAGKHVVLEKPATSTVAEFESLINKARDRGVFLFEAFRHLQEANFKVLKQNLERLGPVYGASFNYASYSSRYNNVLDGETPNIFSLDFSGGSLVDIGVYPISLAVALFGRAESAVYKPVMIRTGVDGGGQILLDYKTFTVHINQSKCYTSNAPSEVYGEKGTITMNGVTDIERVDFWHARTKETKKLAEKKEPLNLLEEAREFARIIDENDRKASQELEDVSRAVIEITMELRRQNGIVFSAEKAA